MASHRANWKGFIKIGELAVPVGLYSATSPQSRISLHMLNRKTGNRLRREFVDSESGKPVETEDQVKGFEISSGEFVVLDDEDFASAIPESDKTLSVLGFIACEDIDTVYFDKPYYLVPSDNSGEEAFVLLREGMRQSKVAALAQTVLFRRARTVLIRAEGKGMVARMLNFDYEIRASDEVFDDIEDITIKRDMMDLAEHIIDTRRGEFHPQDFEDRYNDALGELVKAKIEGRKISPPKQDEGGKVIDLMKALKESAAMDKKKGSGKRKGARKAASASAPSKRKAG